MTSPAFKAEPGQPLAQPWRGSAVDLEVAAAGLAPRWWLRGAHMRTKASLLEEWAAALQLPPYFGGTWDALRDALSDLPEGGTLLVLGADQLLQDAPPEEAGTFWSVLQQVQADLRPKPFHLVLQVETEGYDTLLEGLRALGVS
jgi:hypothetical protein